MIIYMIEDMKNGDSKTNTQDIVKQAIRKRTITEQRRQVLNQVGELLPNINEMYVPQKFQTNKLQKLAEFIRYSIPIHYIPEENKRLLLELTQYYYSSCLGLIQQSHQCIKIISNVSLEALITDVNQQNSCVQLNENKIFDEIQPKSTEIIVKVTEQNLNLQQNIIKNSNTYVQMVEFVSQFKKLSKEVQRSSVCSQTLQAIDKINSWKKSIETVELMSPNNKNFKRKWQSKSQSGQSDIQTASSLTIGINQDKQTKELREELKKRAQNNFKTMSDQKESVMSEKQKTKTNMHFQLNKVSLENIDQIFQELKPYVAEHIRYEESSTVLIQKIIQKCENEHYRYIGTYARLCQKISTISKQNFVIHQQPTKNRKGNLFKRLLIQHLQQQFDSKIINKNYSDSQETLKFFKYQFIGCLTFIAELIKLKVLCQKIINICLATMFLAIIQCIKSQKYSQTDYYKKINEAYVEIYIQGIIKFIETLGVHYNCISINPLYNQQKLKGIIKQIVSSDHPNYNDKELFEELRLANSQGYLSILEIVNQHAYRQCRESSRIDLLIMNIIENFNYALIQQCEQEQDLISENYLNQENQEDKIGEVTPQIKEILQYCTSGRMEQSVEAFKNVIQINSPNRHQKIVSFLRLIADAKEDQVVYRLKIFKKALQSFDDPQIWLQSFKNAWFNDFKYLSTLGSDLKYLTQVLAQIIRMAIDQERVTQKEYSVDCDDQDELQFMNEIRSKLYQFGDN